MPEESGASQYQVLEELGSQYSAKHKYQNKNWN